MCKNTASGLVQFGVLKNDVVAIFSPNSIEYVVMQLGSLAAGGAVTTINSGSTACMGLLVHSIVIAVNI